MQRPTTGLRSAAALAGDLCIGCGVCAAVCPRGALRMGLAHDGLYRPRPADGECSACGSCGHVCPALVIDDGVSERLADVADRLAPLNLAPESQTWGGHVNRRPERLASSSGGLLTALLCHLIETGRITAAVVMSRTDRSRHPYFEMTLARSAGQIRRATGSKYYPGEYSTVLQQLLTGRDRAAVVGLPCQCDAIRRAMALRPSLRKAVVYLLGLTCGHGVSAFFTDLTLAEAGVNPRPYDELYYRSKTGSRKAHHYAFLVRRDGQQVGRRVRWPVGVTGESWGRRLFVPRLCDYCPDCFAESADAVFMDAWLPEYVRDPRGTSLVVARTDRVNGALKEMRAAGLVSLWSVPPTDVIRSQRGVVQYKRELLPVRCALARERGEHVATRASPLAGHVDPAQRRAFNRLRRRQALAARIWNWRLPPAIRVLLIRLATAPGLRQFRRSVKAIVTGALASA